LRHSRENRATDDRHDPVIARTGGERPWTHDHAEAWSASGSPPHWRQPPAYLAYIDRALGEAEQAARQVDEAGAAPVQGGDELTQDVQSRLADLRQDLMQAKTQVEGADPADPVAFGRAAAAAGNILGSMGHSAQAVAAVSGDPQLNAAFDRAESCNQLRTFGTSS